MSATDVVDREDVRQDVDEGPPVRHLVRRSEIRFDGSVLTLCGLVRWPVLPRAGADKCETCVDVLRFIGQVERL